VERELRTSDLSRWKLLEKFRELLERSDFKPTHSSWLDPRRTISAADYYSAFLFGLFNPVVRTMRGLCAATHLQRVQQTVCAKPISPASFSAAQHLLDPNLLKNIFHALALELERRPGAQKEKDSGVTSAWLIQDSTLWDVLPRMHWAFWRSQGRDQSAVRLHVSLRLLEQFPLRAQMTAGSRCERKTWEEDLQEGYAYIGDRYFGEDYSVLSRVEARHCSYVVRLRETCSVEVDQELPIGEEDRKQGVLSDAWIRLGHHKAKLHPRVRLVRVQGVSEVLLLATNKTPEELSAALVSQLYRQRWQVELFFRWIKCILGCRHWLAESREGVATQLYLALIGSLLLQLYSGSRPNRRMFELIHFYTLGAATVEEVEEGLARLGNKHVGSEKNR
jgi:hypothetical protein